LFGVFVVYLLYQAAKPATPEGTTLKKPGGILRPTPVFGLALKPLGDAGPGRVAALTPNLGDFRALVKRSVNRILTKIMHKRFFRVAE